mgnify:CR=1 FL=1|tara:strand:+ start:2147 stop:3799 length:1653 start_codon:yes stop_codon:yes gene_type:complete
MADILSVKATTEPQDIRIETTILEPQLISNTHATFLFNNTGILDKHTRIVVPVTCANTNLLSENQFFLTAGAYGLLRTATLKYQGNDIAQTDEVGAYNSMRRMFKPQNHRNKVEGVKIGSSFAFRPDGIQSYTIDADQDADGFVDNGKVALMNSKYFRGDDIYHEFVNVEGTDYGGTNLNPRYAIQSTTATTFHAIFSLEDLFPEFLGNIQIPLFLLDNQLSLELTFSPESSRRVFMANGVGAELNLAIDTDNVLMVMDLLYYGERTMNAMEARSKGQGIPVVYGDLVNVSQALQHSPASIPAVGEGTLAVNKAQFNIDLGFDNLVVRSLLMSMVNMTADATNANLIGKYSSQASRTIRRNDNTLQLTINNVPLYPQPIDMENKAYDQLQQVFAGTPLQVPHNCYNYGGAVLDEYAISQMTGGITTAPNPVPSVGALWRCNEGTPTDKTNSTLNYTMNAGIYSGNETGGSFLGNQHYLGVNLAKTYANVRGAGVRIGNAPIRLAIEHSFIKATDAILGEDFSAGSRTLNIWANVERAMIIKNGAIFVSEN